MELELVLLVYCAAPQTHKLLVAASDGKVKEVGAGGLGLRV